MKLALEREKSSQHSTIGSLYVNGFWQCWTLEDVVRDVKIADETAIPAGTYNVIVTHSQHFDRDLPLLCDVPNYAGVRIHSGNTDRDTEGCILVGQQRGDDRVGESRKAFAELFQLILEALRKGEKVSLTITNPEAEAVPA